MEFLKVEKMQEIKKGMDFLIMGTVALISESDQNQAVGLQKSWQIISQQMDAAISDLGQMDPPEVSAG
jgi:hypothetical protein